MTQISLNNPFVVGKYVSDEYFCDREQETETLIKHIINGRNVALISPRRMGKTGLIQHLYHQSAISESYYTFFVDIYSTSSLEEFVYLLGKEIFEKLKPRTSVWKELFFSIIKSFRVGFKLDAISGEPSFEIGLGDIRTPEITLDEIFNYLEQADKPCLIAIDEFQQVSKYQEKGVEALLRGKIQHCKQTSFIFAGSERHTMSNMFHSAAKPFYQSSVSMGLSPIPLKIYQTFAIQLFESKGKHITDETITEIYTKYEGCTWFIQMIMNEVFALTSQGETCNTDILPIAYHNVVMSQESSYKEILMHLAPIQKTVLQAIARERIAENITSAEFINKYNLRSASSVQSALKALLKSDIVTRTECGYKIYDYFFADWLISQY